MIETKPISTPPSASPAKTIILTGAAGFIGSHVARALLARGDRVIGIDNFDTFYPRARKGENWQHAIAGAPKLSFELHELDATNGPALHAIFTRVRPDGVIHLAGKAGVRPSLQDPAGYMHANATATAAVLAAATTAGCTRVVVASSSSVYGNAGTDQGVSGAFHEDLDVSRPISPYAASKRATELIAYAHHHATELPIALLRFFTVYGPRQRPDLAISLFLRKIASGEPIEMFGDGTTARDYTFVADIVAGVLAAYDRCPDYRFRIWNLGNNKPVTLLEMISAIERTVGRNAKVIRRPMQAGDVERTWADISRAQRELDYAPTTPFEAGLAAQWSASNAPAPAR